MKRFENKVCLVTGGTSGIGYEIAKRLAEEGGIVIVCSVDSNLEEAAASLSKGTDHKVVALPCDVTVAAQRQQVLHYIQTTHNRIDVLALNAGILGYRGTQLKQSE